MTTNINMSINTKNTKYQFKYGAKRVFIHKFTYLTIITTIYKNNI